MLGHNIYFVDCEDKEVTKVRTDVKFDEIKKEIEDLANEEFDCFYSMVDIKRYILQIDGTEKMCNDYIKSNEDLRKQIDALIEAMENEKPEFADDLRELKTELEDEIIEEILENKLILTNGSFYAVDRM